MAKAKKEKIEYFIDESKGIEVKLSEDGVLPLKECIYIPDIPAQMEKPQTVTTTASNVVINTEISDTDEIVFLRRILQIQQEGCFGKHLDQLIYQRIKQLKGVS